MSTERDTFIRGYIKALNDLNGPLTMERAELIYMDTQDAAERAYDDPGWLERADLKPGRPQPPITAEPPRRSAGLVYAFYDEVRDIYKVGFTRGRLAKRFRSIQQSVGGGLDILAAMPGTMKDERELHAAMHEWRLEGEWFRSNPVLEAWIEEHL